MLPIKKILCPTDFSEPSCTAVSAAGELATAFSAGLVLVHVVEPLASLPAVSAEGGPFEFDVAAYEQALVSSAAERLHQTALKRLPKGMKVVERVVQGSVAAEIVQTAKEEAADLVVLSTHGATGIRHFLLGSVAEKVIRLAECPVLTIRCAGAEPRPHRR